MTIEHYDHDAYWKLAAQVQANDAAAESHCAQSASKSSAQRPVRVVLSSLAERAQKLESMTSDIARTIAGSQPEPSSSPIGSASFDAVNEDTLPSVVAALERTLGRIEQYVCRALTAL